ncbi:uncharacterized protein LOC126995588 isoform X2 [Eriocheir sinensis]|uniref:uncharacterized protein LOC126995588 isoform X1 n=1 Tax=Eriocheir sinensis TaxID=95602 RepID=UPI0021C934ED|nr:uncharacterized protein LOC126995588 isoform X1 [Eriocheir sinensis]XP_050711238.1 uncharacterized protein LOC126995588 isoform X2 [Eriocheir sinensis]
MELTPVYKAVKQAIVKGAMMCAGLGLVVLLVGAVWKAATTASRVCEVVQAWEDKGLHATKVWRARELLARQGWLGPLRPSSPLDPLEACGLVSGEASACWWRLLLQPRQAGRLLACLEERVIEAEHDHEAFGVRLCWGVALALVVPLGLLAARHLLRRRVKGVTGQQESPSVDYFVDAPEADACKALVEDWATPAADSDVMDETWTTATAAVEEINEEECWATPAEYMEELTVKEEESKDTEADDDSVGAESTPTDLSPAVDNSVESEVAKDNEEMDLLATAENVECKKVKEEGGGEENIEMERTGDADNKATDTAEEAAEVPPVSGDFMQGKVVSKDPVGLAGHESQSSTLAAEAVPFEGKAVTKKKRKKRRKKLDPAVDVLKASGEAHVKDDYKTDAKTDAKKEAAPNAETMRKTMPRAKTKGKVVQKTETKRKAVPNAEVKVKAVPKDEIKGKAMTPAEGKETKAVKENVTLKQVTRRKNKPAATQPMTPPPSQPLHSVRQSWQEDVVTVRLPVPPSRRRHVIGQRGDIVRQLRRDYPGVHVAVPLPEDPDAHVTFRGPNSQAAAASREVAKRLQVIEAQIREAARRRQETVATAVLDVAPNRRRLVVGPGGEELLKLKQQHPGVRVSVPPSIDTESRSVTISGPPAEVRAVQAKIKNRLATLEQQRKLIRASWRRRRRGAASAPGASPAKGC